MDKELARRIAESSARRVSERRAQRQAAVDASIVRQKLAEQGIEEDQYKYYREMDIGAGEKQLEVLRKDQEIFEGFATLVGSGGTLDTPIYDGDTPIYFKDYFPDYDKSVDLSTMEGRKQAITPYDRSSEIKKLSEDIDTARLAQSVNLDTNEDFSFYSAPNKAATKALRGERRDSYLTPEEESRYYYLYNTQGEAAAASYMRALQSDLYNRDMQKVYDFADKNLFFGNLSSLASIGTSLLSSIEGAGNMIGYILDRYVGQNEDAKMKRGYFADLTQAMRSGANYDNNGTLSFLYNTFMSGIDSAIAAAIPGSAALLGLSAASQASNDIISRGGTGDQAMIGGIAAGVFEGFFENYSISALKSMELDEITTSWKSFVKNISKQSLTNAQEEAATELANIAFDTIAMGDISNAVINMRKNMDKGMSKSEAIAKVAQTFGLQTLEAGLSGAVMGSAFGAIGAGVGFAERAERGKSIVNDKGQTLKDLITAGEELFVGEEYKGERELLEAVKKNQSKSDAAQSNRVQKLDEIVTRIVTENAKNGLAWEKIREDALKDISETVERARDGADGASIGTDVTYTYMPEISDFSGTDGDSITISQSDGTTAKLSELSFEDSEIYEAYSLAATTGSVENANSFIKQYRLYASNIPAEKFWSAWMGAQNYGQTVAGENALDKAIARYGSYDVPRPALEAAFLSGRSLRKSASESMRAQQSKYEKAWKDAGGKETRAKFDDSALRGKRLDSTQQEYRAFLRVFSRALGVNIEVFCSEKGKRHENGSFDRDTNTLRIDINAGIANDANYEATQSSIITTLSHETVHNVRINAPEQYDSLRDFVMELLQEDRNYNVDDAIDAEIEKYNRKGRDLTREDAIEEIVARACEDRLASSDALRDFMVDFYERDKKAANGFAKAVKEFIAKLKTFFENIIKQKSTSREAELIANKGKDMILELQRRFDVAVLKMRESNMARNMGTNVDKSTAKKQTMDMDRDNSVAIDLSDDTNLSKLVGGVHGSLRYKLIVNYIFDVLGNEPITLSDGTKAIIDNRDASHIASNAGTKKTMYIAKIKDLVSKAKLYAYSDDVEHDKFSSFLYYKARVRYSNEVFSLYLNVGKGLNDKKYHLYDITKTIRDTANRINGFERPKPNEGYALENGISKEELTQVNSQVQYEGIVNANSSTESVTQKSKNVNSNFENSFDKMYQDTYGGDTFNQKNRVTVAQFASKEAVANTPRSPRFDNSISQEYDFVNSDGENILYQERPDKSKQSNFIGQGNGYRGLRKSDFYENSTIYSYDFLVNQSDMRVTQLPEISDVADGNGKIIRSDIVKAALDNARKNGKEVNGVIYVTNEYTERDYGISTQAVRHSLGGDRNRLLTNARVASVIGDVVKNGIPINALKNKASGIDGTYALATLVKDGDKKLYVAISTIEQRLNKVVGIEEFDVVHAVSARQKNSGDTRSDNKSQSNNSPTNISTDISIARFLEIVNTTYQSILSDDVLDRLNEQRSSDGYYSDKVLYQDRVTQDMSDKERAEILRRSFIQPTQIKLDESFDVDFEQLERSNWKTIKKPMLNKLRELGYLKAYRTDMVDISFDFTGEGLRKSMNSQVADYGGNLSELAKVIMNIQPLLDNAVLIEVHSDKAKGTNRENPRLVRVYVMLSAYQEKNYVTPVQFEIKQYVDNNNRLYLAVALTKIETDVISDTAFRNGTRTRLLSVSDKADVMDDTMLENRASTRLLPASKISISQLIEKINTRDENFFKYIPNELLSREQLIAKQRALSKEAAKYGKMLYDVSNDVSRHLNEQRNLTGDYSDKILYQDRHGAVEQSHDSDIMREQKINENSGESLYIYSEKEYNDYGWARANDFLSAGENVNYRAKFALAKSRQAVFPKTKNGEYMIPVSDIYEYDREGIENVIVYAKGTIDNPIITKVLRIDLFEESKTLNRIRRQVNDAGRRGVFPSLGEFCRLYHRTDGVSYGEYKRNKYSADGNNSEFGTYRGAGGGRTSKAQGIGRTAEGYVIYYHADSSELYQERIETPEPSDVLREYFASNEGFEGYKSYAESLSEYRDLLNRVEAQQNKIFQIDQNITRLRSEHRQSGKGTRMDDLYQKRINAEERIKGYRNRMLEMEVTALSPVIEAKIRRELELERQKVAEQGRERARGTAKRKYIDGIEKTTVGLADMLKKNNKNKHVPDALKAPLANLIGAIDFSSKQSLMGGVQTKKERYLKNAVESIRAMAESNDFDSVPELELPPRFMEEWNKVIAAVNKVVYNTKPGESEKLTLEEMSVDDLCSLDRALKYLRHSVSIANDVVSAASVAHINELAHDLVTFLDKFPINTVSSATAGDIKNFMLWANTLPVYAFERLGITGERLFEAFQNGFDKLVVLSEEIQKFAAETFTEDEAQMWSKKTHRFTCYTSLEKDEDGVTVGKGEREISLTETQIMTLYGLYKRSHAVPHLLDGGIVAGSFKQGKEKHTNDSRGVRLTDEKISEIIGKLSPRQREVADKLQRFMSSVCADWGNEVSMKLYGMRQFTEHYYMPIVTNDLDRDVKSGEVPQNARLYALSNPSFSKPLTEFANNQIKLVDIFDVFANHALKMAQYNCLALPARDFLKVLNFREDTKKKQENFFGFEEYIFDEADHELYGEYYKAAQEDLEKNTKIFGYISDEQRAKLLSIQQIYNVPRAGDIPENAVNGVEQWEDIDGLSGNKKRDAIRNIASEFGVFKKYSSEQLGISFEFSKNNFRESYGKQKRHFETFAKMFSVFDEIIESAVHVETHRRSDYKPDPTLKDVHVMMGAFEDGDFIVPVKLEIKEFTDKESSLYVAISSERIKMTEVSKQGIAEDGVAQNSRSVTISISQLARKINPQSTNFTKYFPSKMLTKKQRAELEKATLSFNTEPTAQEGEGIRDKGHLFDTSINQNALNVNSVSENIFYDERNLADVVQDMTEADEVNVRKSMTNAFGEHGVKYFTDFITTVSGSDWTGDNLKTSEKLMQNAKVAMVGFNLRTVVQQPTAVTRALAYLGIDDIGASLSPRDLKKSHELAIKYCPMAKWKSMGHFDIGTGIGLEKQIKGTETFRDKAIEASTFLAEKADEVTWTYLWKACEHYVTKTEKYKPGTEEYYKAVGVKLREVIYKTQVVDSPLTKSQFMSKRDTAHKMFSMFAAEPTVTYNMILDAATNKKRSKREKRVFIAKLCGIFAAQTLVLAAVQSLIDAMRDDDDESYGEKYLDEFWGNLVAELNPLSKLPIIRDVVSIFDGFSVVRPDTTVISKIAIACRDIDKLINGKDVPPYKLIYDILNAASMATGIGASNALRDIVAIWNTFVGEFFPHLKLKK